MLLNPYRYAAAPGGSNLSFIAAATADATSVALPAGWAAGDLAIVIAGKSTSGLPTLPAGWTALGDRTSADNRNSRIGYRVLQSGDTTSGTWTGAGRVAITILRGQHATPVDAANVGITDGNSATITIPTLTMAVTDGTSWVVGLAHGPFATDVESQAPTGMTNRTTGTAGSGRIGAMDTDAGVSSWANATYGVNASGTWQAYSVEVRSS